MAEVTNIEVEIGQGSNQNPLENGRFKGTPDVNNAAMKITRAREAYRAYAEEIEKPSRIEVLGWYLYDLSTYFIQTVLIPIVFPLIISQLVHLPPDLDHILNTTSEGLSCSDKENRLYQALTMRTITVSDSTFSPLQWTSMSWALGLVLSMPFLAFTSFHLDHGRNPSLITIAATAIGAFFCLPAGFFKTVKIFPPYIAAIVAAVIVATSSHTRHLGLMIRGYTGPTLKPSELPVRRGVSGRFSLYATAAGCLGSAIISSFTYNMLREPNDKDFINLWVVSIFSGLKWLAGIFHSISASRPSLPSPFISKAHPFSILAFPQALGSLVGVFFSSFTTMCIFTAGNTFLVGQVCIKPVTLLYFWLTYFIFPSISLPLLQPLQQLLKSNAAKMQILGFILSALTSGFGFSYRSKSWERHFILLFAAIQSTSAGLLHAFGRVLLLDCSPPGKEGAFSTWYSWVKAIGMWAGFGLGSVLPGNIRFCFGTAFCTAIFGMVALIFGNVSDLGGAVDAGHVKEESVREDGLDGRERIL